MDLQVMAETVGMQDLLGDMMALFEMMEWVEDEIADARKRRGRGNFGEPTFREGEDASTPWYERPNRNDPIWAHTFRLSRPTPIFLSPNNGAALLASEVLMRAHTRELCERIDRGQDTRPATDAEIIAALGRASQLTPLRASAVCLMGRLWVRRGMPKGGMDVLELDSYEKVHGRAADDMEAEARHKLRQDWRRPDRDDISPEMNAVPMLELSA